MLEFIVVSLSSMVQKMSFLLFSTKVLSKSNSSCCFSIALSRASVCSLIRSGCYVLSLTMCVNSPGVDLWPLVVKGLAQGRGGRMYWVRSVVSVCCLGCATHCSVCWRHVAAWALVKSRLDLWIHGWDVYWSFGEGCGGGLVHPEG